MGAALGMRPTFAPVFSFSNRLGNRDFSPVVRSLPCITFNIAFTG
jgi:hypothetical protein